MSGVKKKREGKNNHESVNSQKALERGVNDWRKKKKKKKKLWQTVRTGHVVFVGVSRKHHQELSAKEVGVLLQSSALTPTSFIGKLMATSPSAHRP